MPQITGAPKKDPERIGGKSKLVDGTLSELADFVCKDSTAPHSRILTANDRSPNAVSYELLSTSELISAVGHVWDCTSRCLAGSGQKAYPNHRFSDLSLDECNSSKCSLENFDGHIKVGISTSHLSSGSLTHSNLDFVKVSRSFSLIRYGDKAGQSLRQWYLGNHGSFLYQPWETRGPANFGTTNGLRKMYVWMNELIPVNNINEADTCISSEENACDSEVSVDSKHLSSSHGIEKVIDAVDYVSMLSEHSLNVDNGMEENSDSLNSTLTSDCSPKSVPSECGEVEPCYGRRHGIELPVVKQGNYNGISIKETEPVNSHLWACSKHEGPFARQEHAFAGAFSGIFVSICLHPVDTIKTVIQSCCAEQRSLCYISQSIVSTRGFAGLYRGISSNIASSAPISAIYTFTYESVKRRLLPLFPKEYYSIAHCLAGGSASIATSFVFTPSERIKQQMQVNSRYQNCCALSMIPFPSLILGMTTIEEQGGIRLICGQSLLFAMWNALIGIIRNGGLCSLYAGWTAVLCRNIPHSIIKFYTYENLKMWMQSGASLNTVETLTCGGIAGSTAALFTTPFDVVKTRLQTQKPGSASRYNGVLQALLEIGRSEGLKGLYRGLTPRLIMYVSQGSLFFASYEFFKQLFSLNELQPKVHQARCKDEDP